MCTTKNAFCYVKALRKIIFNLCNQFLSNIFKHVSFSQRVFSHITLHLKEKITEKDREKEFFLYLICMSKN